MADLPAIRKRLEKYIAAKHYSLREVSLKIGRKDSYIHQYIKYGFPKRLNEIDRKNICRLLEIDEKELIDDELLRQNAGVPLFENDGICASAAEFISIDICAPHPEKNLFDNIIGRMVLNFMEFGSWCGGNPFSIKIIRMDGDYMSPTIPQGALVLFDRGRECYAGDGLYVVEKSNVVQIKRLQKTGSGTYILSADNPRYEELSCKEKDLTILGRAVYCLNGTPL